MYKNKQNLHLKIQTPFFLNFLIYVQNCYLNNTENFASPKFPYIPFEDSFEYHDEFRKIFNEVWNEVLLNYHDFQDENTNDEKNYLLVQNLFTTKEEFIFFHTSFSSWWKNSTGQLAVQNFFSTEKVDKLYTSIQDFYRMNGNEDKIITIYLIYDNCQLLYSEKTYENQVILSLEDIIMKKDLTERFKHQF